MADKSIGFIETFGLAACIAAADAAVKSANVKLLGYEYAKGDGMCTVKVEGNVGACKAAIAAGTRAAELVNGTHKGIKSVLLKARPADGIMDVMVNHRENVGGDIALAEGYRPKGESRVPVLVKNWKPKDETPIEDTPEPPVENELKEESVVTEEAPVETPEVEEAPVETPVVAEEAPVEAPEAEEAVTVEAPEADDAPVEAPEAEEPAPVEAPEVEEAVAEEAPEAEEAAKEDSNEPESGAEETPKKTTSTGRRRNSRKRKNTDK